MMQRIAFVTFSLVFLLGCSHKGIKNSRRGAATAVDGYNYKTKDLVNKYWKLLTLNGHPVKMTPRQEREQSFTLKSNGTFTGFAGCNSFNGTYTLPSGYKIHFNENMAVTMMACEDQNIKEYDFLQVFTRVNYYTINGDQLTLSDATKVPLATFEAVYF